jgi:S-DNA-T family DNA segregation ATPase FtsK/SpoIIIE
MIVVMAAAYGCAMDHCDECGFVYGDLPVADVPETLQSYGARFRSALDGADAGVLRAKPFPGVWSVLEYACHVRDVLRVQRERVALALVENGPTFTPMGREERAIDERYNEQDPVVVAGELEEAANAIAAAFAALEDDGWARTGVYSWPAPAERSLAWVGRHTVHECVHHLGDLESVLSAGSVEP